MSPGARDLTSSRPSTSIPKGLSASTRRVATSTARLYKKAKGDRDSRQALPRDIFEESGSEIPLRQEVRSPSRSQVHGLSASPDLVASPAQSIKADRDARQDGSPVPRNISSGALSDALSDEELALLEHHGHIGYRTRKDGSKGPVIVWREDKPRYSQVKGEVAYVFQRSDDAKGEKFRCRTKNAKIKEELLLGTSGRIPGTWDTEDEAALKLYEWNHFALARFFLREISEGI
jgi:hypothetical protein